MSNPLAGETEFLADFEQGVTASISEAVALDDDESFPWRKQGQHSMHLFTEVLLCSPLIGSASRTLLKGVGEREIGFLVHGQVKKNGLLDEPEQLLTRPLLASSDVVRQL